MSSRDSLPLGLTLGHLDNHHFLESIASPLGMYFLLLSRAWRSPHKPENKKSPPLETFYNAGLITSWTMDGVLASLFGVSHRTITRWRDWLTNQGLLSTVGQTDKPGRPLAYVLGSWEQRTAESHWSIDYYWDPDARAKINQILAGMTYVRNDIGLSPTYVRSDIGTYVKSDTSSGVTYVKNDIQEEEYRKIDSIKDNLSVLWAAAVQQLALTIPANQLDTNIQPLKPISQDDDTLTLAGPANVIARCQAHLNGRIADALRIATGGSVVKVKWQEISQP